MLIPPRKPTWQRYKKLILSPRYTIYRALREEAVEAIPIKGRVLDLGGGDKAQYRERFNYDGLTYESLNLCKEMRPTYIANANETFPIDDNTYDMVMSFDSLEHIRQIDHAVSECVRIVKPGGKLLLAVPFVYPVHDEPDYHRKTYRWWEEKLAELDMSEVIIEPIIWDPLTSGVSFTERTEYPRPVGRPLRFLMRKLVPLLGVLYWYFRLRREPGDRLPEYMAEPWYPFTLGYVIQAKK